MRSYVIRTLLLAGLWTAGATLRSNVSSAGSPVPEAPTDPAVACELGRATWYGPDFHGQTTASGESFDMHHFTAAHRDLPLGSYVRVTHLGNGRQVVVRINDRGPFASKDRIIDLSYAASRHLGMLGEGVAAVRIEPLAMSN
jgi:rare lipoprotein A